MNFGNELTDDSSPGPYLPQHNASAGCEPEVQRDLTITAQMTGQDTGSLVAIFSITATITNLITFATRRDRPYIVLPNQLTVNQKDLPPTKKRTNQMLRGPHHNSRVRKTPQLTLNYYKRWSRHKLVTKSQESHRCQISEVSYYS